MSTHKSEVKINTKWKFWSNKEKQLRPAGSTDKEGTQDEKSDICQITQEPDWKSVAIGRTQWASKAVCKTQKLHSSHIFLQIKYK